MVNTVPQWLIDSGCGHDLISRADAEKCRASIFKADPVTFCTANGRVSSRDHVRMDVEEFGEVVDLNVLPSTPPVLSLGRRCMREGFSFVWPAREEPYLVRPDGQTIRLQVVDDIPYLSPATLHCRPTPTKAQVDMPYPESCAFPGSVPREEDKGPEAAPEVQEAARAPERAESADEEVPGDEDRKRREAKTLEHCLTHRPRNRFCDICVRTRSHQVRHLRQDARQRPLGTSSPATVWIAGRLKRSALTMNNVPWCCATCIRDLSRCSPRHPSRRTTPSGRCCTSAVTAR